MSKLHSRTRYLRADVPIRRQLLRYLDPRAPLNVFDVGACEGEDSVRYARLFPCARIVAVEPVPENQRRCAALIAREQLAARIALERCALGAVAGVAALHLSSGQPPHAPHSDWDYGNKSSSLYAPGAVIDKHPWLEFNRTIDVSVRTLAEVAAEHSSSADRRFAHIDLLHMDVQGAELDVLRGAGEWLSRISLIWLEVAGVPMYEHQPLQHEVQTFVQQAGFVLVHQRLRKHDGDQLYRRHDLAPRPRLQRLASWMAPNRACP